VNRAEKYFMPFQRDVILDPARLIIVEKGRQIGLSYAVSYRCVRLAGEAGAKLDVWVMSRDELQAKQFLLYCKRWARVLKYAAEDLGEILVDRDKDISAHVLRFGNGLCIYCLSSNPDAIVGKTGHVVLDEFAIHKSQRDLYATAKQVTQWGGSLIILSTHRGRMTVFNSLIEDIKQRGNPMGWSLHTIPIQRAVAEGIVEKINAATGAHESREEFLARQRRECIDEEHWQQEFCCVPADESTSFLSYDLIRSCEDETAPKGFNYLATCLHPLFIGWDVARTQHLSVITVGELVGDILWERLRIEMQNKTFSEQEFELYRLLQLPAVRRCCIDATGIGKQLAERARERFAWKVEAITFTQQIKSDLAWPLRLAMQDHLLRYARDEKLIADFRGIKKEVTVGGNERFVGESADSHCDRFWSWCLMKCASGTRVEIGAMVG